VAGGGFLGEAFSEKVGEGGLFLEGFLAGFSFFGIDSNAKMIK